jgi:hypothetical protein
MDWHSVLLMAAWIASVIGLFCVAFSVDPEIFFQLSHPFRANEARARGWQLLEENLRPAQLEDFRQRGAFEVVGSVTGKRYRIDRNGGFNVTELDEQGNEICKLCFKPSEPLVAGDIILAQKIALETDEESALRVANRALPNGRLIHPVERTRAGLASARARGRKGGRRPKMTPAKLRLAMAAMGKPETNVAALCEELGVTRSTLYRHVSPTGEPRAKVIAKNS